MLLPSPHTLQRYIQAGSNLYFACAHLHFPSKLLPASRTARDISALAHLEEGLVPSSQEQDVMRRLLLEELGLGLELE